MRYWSILSLSFVMGLSLVQAHWLPSANAAFITYQFMGTVDEVSATLHLPGGLGTNGFDLGLKLSGQYTFDTTTPVAVPLIAPQPFYMIGQYGRNVTSFNFSLGNYAPGLQTAGNGSSYVTSGALASYGFNHPVTGPSVNAISPFSFRMDLQDPTGRAFSNLNLPGDQPPDLAGFTSNRWTLTFANGRTVVGSIDSLTPVPSPASLLLFGTGLSAMVGLGLRRTKL